MDRLYGGVCYAGIDTDPELKYPKGAGRVAFSNQQSYIAAISARFVQLQHGEIDKRVSMFEQQMFSEIVLNYKIIVSICIYLNSFICITFRLRSNHMCSTTNSATSAKVHDVVGNSLHFSVQMSPVFR